ncbi:hypothetical protein AXF42_Ash012898 [Apostasia shenzhenica]|uniref:Uncharacterized protein n=1 Tax=Apostasia shenzhenica TaxID=1088818 RepID=A0A2I0ARJ6_9ASPA|nr:hypothetical protein AXF42_Ash012898 [Apostasia shenzhenica]
MDDEELNKEFLQSRVEQLERERDELRKDIEQLCMQQAGSGYLAVAARMHFQRTAGLEQEIESLKKKLAGCIRENRNLQEELSEAYRIKTQLADLHNLEVLKNKEAEEQLKFFQGSVAAAFSERDHALMEFEKAKEHVEAMIKKSTISERRIEDLESTCNNVKELNATLEEEVRILNGKIETFEKVVNKFYEIRMRDAGPLGDRTWQNCCSCLLNDPSDKWLFNIDSRSTTSTYIASLEEEIESQKRAIDRLQTNLRMGLQIEQHLKRSLRFMEKKQVELLETFESKLSYLHHFHNQHRAEVMKLLEEEMSHINAVLVDFQEKLFIAQINYETKREALRAEHQSNDNECKDVHITDVVDPNVSSMGGDVHSSDVMASKMPDASHAFSQALQEKVAALLLLSQQEEMHLLDKEMNVALQKKMQELQRNLSQVTNEKIEALMELAQLKREYQMLRDSHLMKNDHLIADNFDKRISAHGRDGKLSSLLKRTSLIRWIGRDLGTHDNNASKVARETDVTDCRNFPMDFARLKVENAALQESLSNMEHLTSSIHRLHVSLLKVQEDDAVAATSCETILESLNGIVAEANQVKTALGCSLPVSWSVDPTTDAITYESLCEPADSSSEQQRSDRVVCAAGFEMVELLILAALLLKELSNAR